MASRRSAAARMARVASSVRHRQAMPCRGAVEFDEQLLELVGVVPLVTARAARFLDMRGYRLPARLR